MAPTCGGLLRLVPVVRLSRSLWVFRVMFAYPPLGPCTFNSNPFVPLCVCLITNRGNSCAEYGPNVCVFDNGFRAGVKLGRVSGFSKPGFRVFSKKKKKNGIWCREVPKWDREHEILDFSFFFLFFFSFFP